MDGFIACFDVKKKSHCLCALVAQKHEDGRLDRVLANNDNLDSVRQQLAATFLAFAEACFWALSLG